MPATERDGAPLRVARAATGVPFGDLLAACAAARAVSTPPGPEERGEYGERTVRAGVQGGGTQGGAQRPAPGVRRGPASPPPGEHPGGRREAA